MMSILPYQVSRLIIKARIKEQLARLRLEEILAQFRCPFNSGLVSNNKFNPAFITEIRKFGINQAVGISTGQQLVKYAKLYKIIQKVAVKPTYLHIPLGLQKALADKVYYQKAGKLSYRLDFKEGQFIRGRL